MPVNIRSLRKNINLFIANIHNVKRDIDIIIMSEMWIFLIQFLIIKYLNTNPLAKRMIIIGQEG